MKAGICFAVQRNLRQKPVVSCLLLVLSLAACDTSAVRNMSFKDVKESVGLGQSSDDQSIIKVGPDASITIILVSNKESTTFVVNGQSLPTAKQIKVAVPRSRLRITAQAPCYKALEQTAGENDFGPSSLFEFTFANWDRTVGGGGVKCT